MVCLYPAANRSDCYPINLFGIDDGSVQDGRRDRTCRYLGANVSNQYAIAHALVSTNPDYQELIHSLIVTVFGVSPFNYSTGMSNVYTERGASHQPVVQFVLSLPKSSARI